MTIGAVRRRALIPASQPNGLVHDGDSISANIFSLQTFPFRFQRGSHNRCANLSIAGAVVATGTNSVLGRLFKLLEYRPAAVTVYIGANDLGDSATYPATTDWLAALWSYVAKIKLRLPGVKVAVGTLLPRTGNATYMARRSTANAAILAAVGTNIDAVFDFAAHPIMGPDAAASDTSLFSDGLHPTDYGQALLGEVYIPIANWCLGIPNSAAAFKLGRVANAVASSSNTPPSVTVSGLGPGETNIITISGGTYSKNGASATSSPGTVVNGDVITFPAVTASATAGGKVSFTLNIGNRSDTYEVTTAGGNFHPLTSFTHYWDAGDRWSILGSRIVHRISDQIGSVDLFSGTSDKQPQNGTGAVKLNGLNTIAMSPSGRLMSSTTFSIPDEFHFFLAAYIEASPIAGGYYFSLVNAGAGTPRISLLNNGGKLQISSSGVGTLSNTATGSLPVGPILWEIIGKPSTYAKVMQNGVQVAGVTTTYTGWGGGVVNAAPFQLNAGSANVGRFAAAAIAPNELTGAALTEARDFFRQRFNLY